MTDKPIDFVAKRNLKLARTGREDEQDIVVCYIQGVDPDDQRVFSYVAIPAQRLEEFNAAVHAGNLDVDDYGYRIVSGFGEPCESVKEMMANDYGFEH